MTMYSASSPVVRLSKPAGVSHNRNAFIPELVVCLENRATADGFNDCGALAVIIRKPGGGFLVQVTKQYALGGQQYLETKRDTATLRDAYKLAHGLLRQTYRAVVGRKFLVDVAAVVTPVNTEDVSE